MADIFFRIQEWMEDKCGQVGSLVIAALIGYALGIGLLWIVIVIVKLLVIK